MAAFITIAGTSDLATDYVVVWRSPASWGSPVAVDDLFFRTPRERDEFLALLAKWHSDAIAQARLDWLRERRRLGWQREEPRRPAARPRQQRAPWPVSVTAWRVQETRLRKGSRESGRPLGGQSA